MQFNLQFSSSSSGRELDDLADAVHHAITHIFIVVAILVVKAIHAKHNRRLSARGDQLSRAHRHRTVARTFKVSGLTFLKPKHGVLFVVRKRHLSL
ncbi:hypothetical protein [Burkholderia contaminans]|uniref:hypothetical protein n=1 Tax=Burkholderia contaminans TaxID=488447 RepID=UPI0032EA132A